MKNDNQIEFESGDDGNDQIFDQVIERDESVYGRQKETMISYDTFLDNQPSATHSNTDDKKEPVPRFGQYNSITLSQTQLLDDYEKEKI